MAKQEKAARNTRTPAERAQDALDRQKRVVTGLEKKADALRTERNDVVAQLEVAERKLAYLAQNPDLPEQPDEAGSDTVDGAVTAGTEVVGK